MKHLRAETWAVEIDADRAVITSPCNPPQRHVRHVEALVPVVQRRGETRSVAAQRAESIRLAVLLHDDLVEAVRDLLSGAEGATDRAKIVLARLEVNQNQK